MIHCLARGLFLQEINLAKVAISVSIYKLSDAYFLEKRLIMISLLHWKRHNTKRRLPAVSNLQLLFFFFFLVLIKILISTLPSNVSFCCSGRRRRSQSRFLDVLFNQSEEDNGDPIPRDYNDFLYNYNRDYNYLQSLH